MTCHVIIQQFWDYKDYGGVVFGGPQVAAMGLALPAILVARTAVGLGEGVALPCMINLVSRNISPARRSTALGTAFTGFHAGVLPCPNPSSWRRHDGGMMTSTSISVVLVILSDHSRRLSIHVFRRPIGSGVGLHLLTSCTWALSTHVNFARESHLCLSLLSLGAFLFYPCCLRP